MIPFEIPEYEWLPHLELWIPGDPVAQPRAKAQVIPMKAEDPRMKFRKRKGRCSGCTAHIFTPDTLVGPWKTWLRRNIAIRRPIPPLQGVLRCDLVFVLPRPQSMMTSRHRDGLVPMPKTPDEDNLRKAVLDSISDCKYWEDDKLICDGRTRKFYGPKDGTRGVLVQIFKMASEEQLTLLDKGDHE